MDLWSEAKFSKLDFVFYLIYNPIFDIRLIKEAGRNFILILKLTQAL